MKRKRIGIVALAVLPILALASCSGNPGTSGPVQEENPDFITVPVRAGGCFTTWSEIAADYEAETGMRVNVQEVGRDNYIQRITTELLGGSSNLDIAFMLHNYVPQFAQGGQIEPLDSYIENSSFSMDRYVPELREAVALEGSTYALPYDLSTMHLFYRTDLIDAPPTTPEEFRAIALENTRSVNPDSATEFGATYQAKRGEALPKEWYNWFFAQGGEFLDADGGPALNSPSAVQALDWVIENAELGIYPPDFTTFEFTEAVSAFQAGKTAMMLNFIGAYPRLTEAEAPEVFDKFAVAPVPSEHSYFQAWTVTINAASTKKQAAFDFLEWATTEGMERYGLRPCWYPPVTDYLEDPATVAAFPEAAYVVEALANAKTEPSLPVWPSIHEAMNEALSAAIAKERSSQDALDAANDEATRLMGR